jgi:aspartate oxidase
MEQSGTVYLDYRKVPADSWNAFPLTLLSRIKYDFQNAPFAIAPAAHFCMGGLRTDERGRTDLPGLFACGEMVWGLHGANRRGGNALTECLVSGRLAGFQAALEALSSPPGRKGIPPTGDGMVYSPVSAFGEIRALHQTLKDIAWRQAGIVRSRTGLNKGLARLQILEAGLTGLKPGAVPERKRLEDLYSAVLVTRAVLTAGLAREESRGSFIREDFPDENNIHWRKNSRLTFFPDRNNFEIDYVEVGGGS